MRAAWALLRDARRCGHHVREFCDLSRDNEIVSHLHARSALVIRPLRARFAPLIALVLPFLLGAGGGHEPPAAAMLLDRLPAVWRDDRDQMLQLPELHGRRIFVTMAYATCHRICPMTMARLADIQSDLDARGTSAEFLIVSYDPRNDDSAAWRRYRADHGLARKNWHFLTGTSADTQRLARLLGFEFWNYDEHVMHDYRIVALNGDGGLRGAIDSAHSDWRALL
jgi:cytochrome oxidase Cu insertion factor (SCO1/SenC/PrrC family)